MTFRMTGTKQLLARHGRNLKLNYNNVSSNYNPATGTVTKVAFPPVFVRGYFYQSKNSVMDETEIDHGDRKVIIYPFSTNGVPIRKPEISDSIEGQRDTVSIEGVHEVTSGEKTLFYICSVKE